MSKTKKGMIGLALGALGVVFGDIGTSPLYALQAVFGPLGQHLPITQENVHGIISLVIWSVTLIVSVKYIGFIMRADNKGEGGGIALVARIKSGGLSSRYKWFFILLGIVGVAFFFGDSAITPAISVLSAIEGLKVVAPSFSSLVLPIALITLTFLFLIQRYGTTIIGRLFGPIMFAWFVVIAIGGGWQIWQHPDILVALSPLPAIEFFVTQPLVAFVAMGAVMLAVTGAEALYTDMGHFGRGPIARAWFLLVFPALLLCYMGQGALLLHSQDALASPFLFLFPETIRIPIILLATLATLIASQAVISGAFSLTRQAVQLGFLPKMLIRHTSTRQIGQIYLPFVNAALFVSVVLLVLLFGSSEKLANVYGLAVSATLAVDTILFIVIARTSWHKSLAYVACAAVAFLLIDLLFISANLSKVWHGAWVPIVIAASIFLLIHTWIKGQEIVVKKRKRLEGSLQGFIDKVHASAPSIPRVPGQAVYIGHHDGLTPLALHATVEQLHELHEKVVIVLVNSTNAAHVPEEERAVFNNLGYKDGISSLTLSYGFHDTPNVPKTLKTLRHTNPELDFDPDTASYFVSLSKIVPTKQHNLAHWRKSLYSIMANNAVSTSDYYKLPIERTIEIRSLIEL